MEITFPAKLKSFKDNLISRLVEIFNKYITFLIVLLFIAALVWAGYKAFRIFYPKAIPEPRQAPVFARIIIEPIKDNNYTFYKSLQEEPNKPPFINNSPLVNAQPLQTNLINKIALNLPDIFAPTGTNNGLICGKFIKQDYAKDALALLNSNKINQVQIIKHQELFYLILGPYDKDDLQKAIRVANYLRLGCNKQTLR